MKVKLLELKKLSPLPPAEFDFIAGEFLNLSAQKLLTNYPDLLLDYKQINKFKLIEEQVSAGTPPQYIFKKAWFYNNEFYVDENVLIPRPETELLIDEAKKFLDYNSKASVLDVGTGSGIIAITLKKLYPLAKVMASDVSDEALAVAKNNILKHKTELTLRKSNLLENITEEFDLICANLPYIDPLDEDLKNVADPRISLVGGKNGFELIEKTISALPNHLSTSGQAIFEIGYNQDKLIKEYAKEHGFQTSIINDLNDFPRIALISK